jgi:thioesterase domain-containing protein
LARALDIDNPVLALTLDDWLDVFSGHADTQYINASSNYDNLVDRYYQAIRHYDRLDECVLCGFSFAGLVALGLAERLESAGKSVASVALIDTHTPDYFDCAGVFNRVAKKIVDTENRMTTFILRLLRADKIFKHALFKNMYTKRLQLARLEACKAMVVPKLATQVTLFRAVKRSFYDPKKIDLGWCRHFPELNVFHVTGKHMGMMRGQHALGLARKLRGALFSTAEPLPATQAAQPERAVLAE